MGRFTVLEAVPLHNGCTLHQDRSSTRVKVGGVRFLKIVIDCRAGPPWARRRNKSIVIRWCSGCLHEKSMNRQSRKRMHFIWSSHERSSRIGRTEGNGMRVIGTGWMKRNSSFRRCGRLWCGIGGSACDRIEGICVFVRVLSFSAGLYLILRGQLALISQSSITALKLSLMG